MANIDRVEKAIAVMTRVRDRGDNLNMEVWQEWSGLPTIGTEKRLHNCGTAACFAGWLAVSPEFQADGGAVGANGRPVYAGQNGSAAIETYLQIDPHDAECLCAIDDEMTFAFYGVASAEVTPQMVIDELQEIIDNG